MSLVSPAPSEPPPADPIPPSLPPPPNILAIISPSPGPDPATPTVVPSQPSPNPTLAVKSFRDTLVDGNASIEPPLVTYEELVAANLEQESSTPMAEDGSHPSKPKIPKVRIPKSIWQRLCAPWKNAVIIKLLGKSVNFHSLHSRLLKEWRTERGPYKMFDHYLAVQPWEPGFHPARAKAPKTAVWVKLHGVPIVCFHEAICLYLGSKIGKPIKVDPTTLLAARGKFARVCIQVDLSQPLPSSVDLDLEELPQSLIPVEFEGLHKICFQCGEFGHTENYCRFKNPGKASPVGNPSSKAMIELTQTLKPNQEENDMTFGPWMVQQRKPRRQQQPRRSVEPSAGKPTISRKVQDPHKPITKNQAQSLAPKIIANSGSHESRSNRFAVMSELMGEETDLLNSNMVTEPSLAGSLPQTEESTEQAKPMDINIPSPPPAPSTDFVKPQHKRRKAKSGGPIPKDSKPTIPKPYQPSQGINKQKEPSSLLPTMAKIRSKKVPVPRSTSPMIEVHPQHHPLSLAPAPDQNQAPVLASVDSAIMVKIHPPQAANSAEADSPDLPFMSRLGYDKQHRVHSLGRAGGLWLFWKSSLVDLEVLSSNNQAIHGFVKQQRLSFFITFAYAQPHTVMKNEFWSFLHDLALSTTESWVVMGDFNDIATVDEASPRAVHRFTSARHFREHLEACHLHSKDSLGCKFTWIRQTNGRVTLRERLDRALFNLAGLEEFPDAKLINLPRLCSDHHPIMLNIDPPNRISRATKPPRFEAAWLTHGGFKEVFCRAWMTHDHSLPLAISAVRTACFSWNKTVFGDLFRSKRLLRARLRGIQNSPHYNHSLYLQNLEMELLEEYHKVLHAEELFWCQKSRVEWINSGDRNTRFYHASTVIRRAQNRITALKVNDSWVTDPIALKNHVQDFFVDLFSQKVTRATDIDYSCFQPKMSDEDSASLLLPISMEEVKLALFSMKGLKSPGPDGRSTTDNIILVQEAIHSMRRLKGKKGALAFKIDLHKAFDSVDWNYLREVLIDFNLPDQLVRLIMFSVTSLQLSVIWNGEELPYFQPKRGLRQGDPLSPYLFIMVMEKLSHMIMSRLQEHKWTPFRLSHGGLTLSHLFFADDLMLFGKASITQIETIIDCLSEFARRSGLEINLGKSKLFVSPNIQGQLANSFSSACGIPLTHDLGIYLGVPIIHGRFKASNYKYILEKMQIKLAGWKQKSLSLAGRRTLVQSVTSSIPTYTMQTVLLPSSTCSAIDSLNRKFLWGSDIQTNKPHLVHWNDVCLPRRYGGLGVRSAKECNKALIAKLGWQILSGGEKPWCQAIKHKYLHSASFSSCKPTPSSSITWRSILKTREVLQLGTRWRVGSGCNIQLWNDIWVGCTERVKLFVWLLWRGKILTNSVRFERHMAPTPVCPRCEQSPETPLHLLRDCFYSRLVWQSASLLPIDFFSLNFDSWLKRNAITPRQKTNSPNLWPFVFLATIWHLWKSRNKLVFEGQRIPPHLVANQAHTFALESRFALESVNLIHDTRTPKWVSWTPPPHPYLKLNTDGSHNHHSGKAAAGGLIRDHNGRWVHGFAVNIGPTTSFLAELWGCKEGLKLAHSLGIQQLISLAAAWYNTLSGRGI
ncbi:hypothetical protein SLEP1_g5773 [Rubroshorea leprosula]|uniref:Uncharacterized protein n=1 Tax=Rubroshorea leprosula TaxID=152421 RepID=A0AAV5HZ92_9ROSI|nr:hypothetical protein SLEP1_g5773 [Rubroshorea leprosula]